MENEDNLLPLVERLRGCAALWVEDQSSSPARLGRLVMNDGGFFSRIESNPVTTTVTLSRFAEFFTNPENWSGGIPSEVAQFARIIGTKWLGSVHNPVDTADAGAPSQGKAGDNFPAGAGACGAAA